MRAFGGTGAWRSAIDRRPIRHKVDCIQEALRLSVVRHVPDPGQGPQDCARERLLQALSLLVLTDPVVLAVNEGSWQADFAVASLEACGGRDHERSFLSRGAN